MSEQASNMSKEDFDKMYSLMRQHTSEFIVYAKRKRIDTLMLFSGGYSLRHYMNTGELKPVSFNERPRFVSFNRQLKKLGRKLQKRFWKQFNEI